MVRIRIDKITDLRVGKQKHLQIDSRSFGIEALEAVTVGEIKEGEERLFGFSNKE